MVTVLKIIKLYTANAIPALLEAIVQWRSTIVTYYHVYMALVNQNFWATRAFVMKALKEADVR